MPTKTTYKQVNLNLSPKATEQLSSLSESLGLTKKETVQRGLRLMSLLAQAEEDGKALGLIDADGRVESKFLIL